MNEPALQLILHPYKTPPPGGALAATGPTHELCMKDFTHGSVTKHILSMAAMLAVSMLAHIACQLVDLYFVARLGVAPTAGVNAAGNVIFIVNALVQVLSAGTAALVAHGAGRKDRSEANLIFNQSLSLSVVCGVGIITLLYAFNRPYVRFVAADAQTLDEGVTFLKWVLPAYGLMLPLAAMSAGLRGTGIVQPAILVYVLTVAVNVALAPVLIAGWGTGVALGVQGAGLSTSVSFAVGVAVLCAYIRRGQHFLTMSPALMRPRMAPWRRILKLGVPAGGEFVLLFLSTATAYFVIRDFGPSAQAGFGIGSRVIQALLLPAMAIAVAAGPIAAQNFGAGKADRVLEVFRKAALLNTAVMLGITVLVQWQTPAVLKMFDVDGRTFAVAASFLQLTSLTFVIQGFLYVCSAQFNSLGNTLPALISAAARFSAFGIAAVWLSMQASTPIEHVWYAWIASIVLQLTISLWLLRIELNARVLSAGLGELLLGVGSRLR